MTPSTDLESSIKGFSGAIFHSCTSESEGKIRFELLLQRVSLMFKTDDPFAGVGTLMSHQDDGMSIEPPVSTPTPTPQPAIGPSNSQSQWTVIIANSQPSTSAPSSHRAAKATRLISNQGWFIAWNAAIPGVYYGA